jgi:hypothetical protein
MARTTLQNNAKFKLLCRRLGLARVHVRGHLETLWDSAHECGNPVIGSPEHVEAAAEWEGEVGALFKALQEGWIDEADPGKWELHDYWDHAPEYVRKRRIREQQREATGDALKRQTTADNGSHPPPNGGQRQSSAAERRTTADERTESAPNGKPRTPAPTPTLTSPPSAHSTAGEREDGWIAEARDRIMAAYPPASTGGELDAERAIFEMQRLGMLFPDGEQVQHRRGITVDGLCSAISAWKASDPWGRQGGFAIPKLRNFLEKGIYLTPPPPPGSQCRSATNERRAAGAHTDPQHSRVQRLDE